jgi:NAD-dependent DNA ligase
VLLLETPVEIDHLPRLIIPRNKTRTDKTKFSVNLQVALLIVGQSRGSHKLAKAHPLVLKNLSSKSFLSIICMTLS